MAKFNSSIARDISVIFPNDDFEIHIIDRKAYVLSNFRNHKIITEFLGNGVIKIYSASTLENLKDSKCITYNLNWSLKDHTEGYKICVKQLFSKK